MKTMEKQINEKRNMLKPYIASILSENTSSESTISPLTAKAASTESRNAGPENTFSGAIAVSRSHKKLMKTQVATVTNTIPEKVISVSKNSSAIINSNPTMKPVRGYLKNMFFFRCGILNSNCLFLLSSLKGFVKSCISNTDYQFYILGIILSGIRTLFKIITGTILFLSLLILWNTGAHATDNTSSNGYWIKKYIAAVEQRNEIPRGLLSAIVSIESGFNPYAVNIEGKTVTINDKSEAVKTIKEALNQGITNIDIGSSKEKNQNSLEVYYNNSYSTSL